jgi:putative DNA primase/helicase
MRVKRAESHCVRFFVYWDDSNGPRVYLFTSAGLRQASKGFDFTRVLKALGDAGAFVKTGKNEKAITTNVPEGGSKKLYWIDPNKL